MRLPDLLNMLGIVVPDDTVELLFVGGDAYDASVPVADLDGPIWLVWRMNGEPLTDAHGLPARLLVPGRTGVKNVKWITEIAFLDHVHEGFWDIRGWSHLAPYVPNGGILLPVAGLEPVEAPVTLHGVAFAGSDPVVRVEVTSDDRATWADAELLYAPGPDRWVVWRYVFSPPGPGTYTITCRAHTASGRSSDPAPDEPHDGGLAASRGCTVLTLEVR